MACRFVRAALRPGRVPCRRSCNERDGYRKRETFAYACEAYGWIVEHTSSRAERLAKGEEFGRRFAKVGDERVDPAELAEIVREACEARNGWKVILRRCSPLRRRSARQLPVSPRGAGTAP
jgi:hypothetical protein